METTGSHSNVQVTHSTETCLDQKGSLHCLHATTEKRTVDDVVYRQLVGYGMRLLSRVLPSTFSRQPHFFHLFTLTAGPWSSSADEMHRSGVRRTQLGWVLRDYSGYTRYFFSIGSILITHSLS